MATPPAHHDDDSQLAYARPELTRFDGPWHLWPKLATIHFGITCATILSAFVAVSGTSGPLAIPASILALATAILLFPSWLALLVTPSAPNQIIESLFCCAAPVFMIVNSIIWGLTLNCIVVFYRYWQHKRALQTNRK